MQCCFLGLPFGPQNCLSFSTITCSLCGMAGTEEEPACRLEPIWFMAMKTLDAHGLRACYRIHVFQESDDGSSHRIYVFPDRNVGPARLPPHLPNTLPTSYETSHQKLLVLEMTDALQTYMITKFTLPRRAEPLHQIHSRTL